jgi:hypothetical protein
MRLKYKYYALPLTRNTKYNTYTYEICCTMTLYYIERYVTQRHCIALFFFEGTLVFAFVAVDYTHMLPNVPIL